MYSPNDLMKALRVGRMGRALACALGFALAGGAAGCEDLLDVENPNNLIEDDLNDFTGAKSIANGSQATVTRAILAMLGPYSAATDEVIWIGSRDSWLELDYGNLAYPANEFTDDMFRWIGQSRWMADEAIKRLDAFDKAGKLVDRSNLARSYLYAAAIYIAIGDMMDDFAFSDKTEAKPPIGPANMGQLYDKAVEYATKALSLANTLNDAALRNAATGMRARAHHAKGIWAKVNPVNTASPLVNVAAANTDAGALIASVGVTADYSFNLVAENNDMAYAGETTLAYLVNQRAELQLGPTFVKLSANKKVRQGTAVIDPIDKVADPVVSRIVGSFVQNYVYMVMPQASSREAHLILAEAGLASGNNAQFTLHINHVRDMDKLTPYSGQIPALDMLKHARMVNFFLQGRRLTDLYRFGMKSPEWLVNSDAVKTPGTFFPITCIERRANPAFQGC